jgi:glyoxalase family protein
MIRAGIACPPVKTGDTSRSAKRINGKTMDANLIGEDDDVSLADTPIRRDGSPAIHGLHHVTAIAGDPQRNLDFYVGLLGLRLVKRTINFDDPGTYHFYFGDAVGTPGTILTFFPWPAARRGSRGAGEVEATAFAIPLESINYWLERLREHHVAAERLPERFGAQVIRLLDADGMLLELVAAQSDSEVQPWSEGSVAEEHSIRGFHSVSVAVEDHQETATFLIETFGYRLVQEMGNRFRFAAPGKDVGKMIDLIRKPESPPGRLGTGLVHHIAFRVPDEAQQNAWRVKILDLGYDVSSIMDRVYFRSIYFREPGGVLFEMATDPPGFATDENVRELGTHLCLPPWMEGSRAKIEQILPEIR